MSTFEISISALAYVLNRILTGDCYNIDLEPKSHEISFINNLSFCCQIALKHCTDHDRLTAALCANFQNYSTIGKDLMGGRYFSGFTFRTRFIKMQDMFRTHVVQCNSLRGKLHVSPLELAIASTNYFIKCVATYHWRYEVRQPFVTWAN